MNETVSTHENEVLFDAVITPHRSLGRRGFLLLMLLIGGVSFVCGLAFTVAGAWPVIGFFGIDVALVWLAFRLNYRSGRAVEYVKLTRSTLIIRRFDHRGNGIEIEMQPYWLKVELAGSESAEEIRLRSHGEIHTVGAFLSPAERVAFANALREALDALRRAPHLDAPPATTPA
jgi:uncharacterized membrane protein